MRIRAALLTLSLIALPLTAEAKLEDFSSYIDAPQKVSVARLTHLFWDVYDIALYAPNGQYNPEQPFALQITYLLDLKGEKIAEAGRKEMKKLGMKDKKTLKEWETKMTEIFPDVSEGETLTGIRGSDGFSYFYNDGKFIGTVQDPEFTHYFFNIWLSPETSRPSLRRDLLGKAS